MRASVPAFLFLASTSVAQAAITLHGMHVLASDGASFREAVLELVGDEIRDVRAPRTGETFDRELGDAFVVPGLIDLHTHMLLHPYDEATWDQQVLQESLELRSMRATTNAMATLLAGFVVVRDLVMEGAGLADVALRDAIRLGILQGPLVIPTTRALVATGCYGPNYAAATTPKGAQVADGVDGVRRAVREQIAAGASWIKVYADYRRAPGAAATPTYTLEELTAACDEAASAGSWVAAHASTDEGMRRAVLAGVRTIEHGSGASEATLQLMVERNVVLCPCLAANEAILRYAGRAGAAVNRLNPARVAFQRALAAGVTVACGSDAGVFTHGHNAREIELMVEFGMTPAQGLAAATTVAAQVLGRGELGRIQKGSKPGLVVLSADPLQDPANLRKVTTVWWGGREWRPVPAAATVVPAPTVPPAATAVADPARRPSMSEATALFAARGAQPGQPLPKLSLVALDGTTIDLASLQRGRPMLLVTCSVTCNIARRQQARVRELAQSWGDRVAVLMVYTIEAHPKGDASPYSSEEWVPPANESDDVLVRQPTTLAERLLLANRYASKWATGATVVVDTMDNASWQALGEAPNVALCVGKDGIVIERCAWFDAERAGKVLQRDG